MAQLVGRRLQATWTVVVSTGEAIGFVPPVLAGVVSADWPPVASVPLVVAAGTVEGAVLGWSQSIVLRRVLPEVRRLRWIPLTMAGASLAYLLGSAPAAIGRFGMVWTIAAVAVAGPALLVSLGGLQWLELRHHLPSAGRWIAWTALAWLAALGVFFIIAPPLWHPGQPVKETIAIGVLAGVAMAVVQAACTGWGLQRMLRGGGDGGI